MDARKASWTPVYVEHAGFIVKKSVDIAIACVKNVEKKKEILAATYQLQVSQTPTIFLAASTLFVEQYLKRRGSKRSNIYFGF